MTLQLLPLTESSPLLWTGFLGAATLVVALVVTIADRWRHAGNVEKLKTSSPTPSRQRRPHAMTRQAHWSSAGRSGHCCRSPSRRVNPHPRHARRQQRRPTQRRSRVRRRVLTRPPGGQWRQLQSFRRKPPRTTPTASDHSAKSARTGWAPDWRSTLSWSVVDNALTIRIIDHCVQTSFEMPVRPDRGSFAFHHPFAYAAEKPGHQIVAHAA